ncbi:MAG: glycosyl transferase family [Desulfobulbaceae bacterium]|nr:MAG: glycosyl transferase family [Desulfobulbaceae bacterium]
MAFLSTLFVSLVLTIAMIPVLSRLAVRWHMLDVPDERKVHETPVPRCGGVAMAVGAFIPILYWYSDNPFILSFLLAAGVIVFFGISDDFLALRPRWKVLGQIIAALIVIYGGDVRIVFLGGLLPDGMLLPAWISVPLTLLVIVGVTNAINLADGLDGLAGGISLLAMCCIGYLAYMTGRYELGLVCLAFAGALFGFLRFNTHPASIFMGDSGSQLLGFSAITLSLTLTQQVTAFSPLIPLLLFGAPVLDTLTVMTSRIKNGRPPFSPDRTHFHHRLLDMGLFHSETVLTLYLVQAILVLVTFFLRFQSEYLILSVYLLFTLITLSFFHYANGGGGQSQRYFALDQYKARLRSLRDQRRIVKFAFPCLKYLLFSLMLLSSFCAPKLEHVPVLSVLAVGALLLLMRYFRPEALGKVLRMVFYLVVPYAVYGGDCVAHELLGDGGDLTLSIAFVVMLMTGMVVTMFSTRQQGFTSTPLDFLILLIVLLILILPGMSFQDQRLGLIGLKCIIFYISFEVVVADMRGKNDGVLLVTTMSFLVFALKSYYGN